MFEGAVGEICVPEGKALRLDALGFFPFIRRVRGWLWVSSEGKENKDGEKTEKVERILGIATSFGGMMQFFFPGFISKNHVKILNERAQKGLPLLTAYKNPETLISIYFQPGHLSLEFACEDNLIHPSWFHALLMDLFKSVPLNDVFLDVTKKQAMCQMGESVEIDGDRSAATPRCRRRPPG